MIRLLQTFIERKSTQPSSRAGQAAPMRLRWILLLGALLLATSWFAHKSVQDFNALQTANLKAAQLEQQLNTLRGENTNLQIQIHRLSTDNIDLDFLDERTRLVLGLTKKGETIIFFN